MSPISLFGHKEREISSCTFMIFTVWSWRSSELSQLKNNLQPGGFDESLYPVLCAKKWVSSLCSRISEMISLSIERLFSIPCYDGHQSLPTPSTFISLHFCATSLGLLLAIMYLFFQAHALLTNSSHGSYSLQDTPRLQHVFRLVTPNHSPEPTNSLSQSKIFTIGLIDTTSAVTRSLEDMFSRISKNKILTFY